ncbi:hypothetical protein [Aliarcobacter cibarius]|uniref:Uncharacterized protein n=1 Tax=Aliarcobacter cibarius TaxID=255507 RepID=A0A7L5JT77_9BACT|nr:hypothetical protein [Aliarcobacter cibarius]QKJ28108.1 hypothetical protein ACBT_2228 [Aliarcobacter cibarius]TLT05252.1 hypothetical protein FE248_00745 [Aliarcobacter cibarius]
MNDIKSVIQKEEYISLAINKYILQNGKIPKKNDNTLDWDKLLTTDYLGTNFNKYNPLTKQSIKVIFDVNNNTFIKGVFESESSYTSELNYLYNFYINKIFRVNTIPPKDNTKSELAKGSQVLYNKIQKDIVNVINENKYKIFLPTQNCEVGNHYYELKNESLIYKFCKTSNTSIEVYQTSPVYLESLDDLKYVKVEIGEKAYVKDGISWYEYFYEGNGSWIPVGTGRTTGQINDEISIEDRILSYIPDSKDLVLKPDGGCMLANGDIFCWGKNVYKKAGIENYGQLDTTLKANYVNTPVMLKVQNENIKTKTTTLDLIGKKWYNNPYRVKFEKMAMNSKFVCGISPIFDYYELGIRYKKGGDLYCNGYIHSDDFFTETTGQTQTSILTKSKAVSIGKENGIFNQNSLYLKDIAMVEGTLSLLTDTGIIYTVGSNDKGALGIDNQSGLNIYTFQPQKVNPDGVIFKKIYALRDIKSFGALDTNNYFWIWGERPSGEIYYKPRILSNSKRFDQNGIFVNSKEFVLKGLDNKYYRTYLDTIKELNVEEGALSVSVYDFNGTEELLYVDKNMQLKGSSDFINCRDKDFNTCLSSEDNILFKDSFDVLNNLTNSVNNTLYANFSNISIFESNVNKNIVDYGTDYVENFENNSTAGWNVNYIVDGGTAASKFLGRLGKEIINTDTGSQAVFKTIDLGTSWANQNVKITFDMYEIGSWDANNYWADYLNGKSESFYVYINDLNVSRDIYSSDPNFDTKGGVDLDVVTSSYTQYAQKHEYSFTTTLDSGGKVKLGFGAILGEKYDNESFGIDNIRISRKIDNVNFTNGVYYENFEDGNHDYWIVPRGPVPFAERDFPYFANYPIYTGHNESTKFLGRFNRQSSGGDIYNGNSDGTQEVYKIFSFGSENANKEVKIDYDFYRIDIWRDVLGYTTDEFYTFINGTRYTTYRYSALDIGDIFTFNIPNTGGTLDNKHSFTKNAYLDSYGNIKLGFGAYIKDNYINQLSWGIDNVKFTLTGNKNPSSITPISSSSVKLPYICAMTGIGSASQMYCWGNVGRSIPILSTSLYDVGKINTINKLFITQESEKTKQMAFDNFNNSGSLFLKYPTYIGGFDYPFYFK